MSKVPAISESEWKVMKVIWGRPPQPASQIIEALSDEDWHPNTIKTLLSRLHKKKAVGIQKDKNHYMYYALVSEAESVQLESESFLSRVFGGSVKPLLMHFVEKQRLSSADLDDLRKILKQKQK
jgi:BlaI family transcriptional regulator, penicillinase repressor